MHPILEEILDKQETAPPSSNMTIEGKPATVPKWKDPDTFTLSGQSGRSNVGTFRVEGMNAPEVGHVKGGVYVPGEYQGASALIPKVAEEQGFTDVQPVRKDAYGRTVAKVINPATQESLGDFATRTGLVEPNTYTNPKLVSDKYTLNAFSTLFPEAAQRDPVLKAVADAKSKQSAALKEQGLPQYLPKVNMFNEAQYAGFKGSVGTQAQARLEKDISDIEKQLKDPNMPNEVRVAKEKELATARNNMFLAGTTPDIVGGVMYRSGDRNIMNQANDQLTTSFNNGIIDIMKGVGGLGQMVGDKAKWDWLSNKASAAVSNYQIEQSEMPDVLSSFRDVRTDQGAWKTASDTATYVGNLFAGTLPQMSLLAASAMVTGGGSMAAAALSSVPSSALYAGQYYAEQPDDKKNASLAIVTGIASGIADRLGLEALTGGKQILTRAGREEAVNALIKSGKATTTVEANKIIEEATKAEILSFTKAGEEFARREYSSAEAFMRQTGAGVGKTFTEGSTEMLQQYLQMSGQSGEWNRNFEYQKGFTDQLVDAGIGGGAMGAVMHVPSHMKDFAQWHSLADDKRLYQKTLDEAAAFQAHNQTQMENKTGGFPDIATLAYTVKNSPTYENAPALDSIPTPKGFFNGLKELVTDPGRFFRQLAHTAVPSIVDDNGRFKTNLAYIKAIMGGYGILPGEHTSGFNQRLIGEWNTTTKETLASQLKMPIDKVDPLIKWAWDNVWSLGNRLDTEGEGTEREAVVQKWKDDIDRVHRNMLDRMTSLGIPVEYLADQDALFNHHKIDPLQVASNRQLIVDEMVNAGADAREAERAVDNLLSNNKQKVEMGRDYMNLHGILSNPNLSHIFVPSIIDSINHIKDDVARKVTMQTYLGRDGEVLARLLEKAKQNGEFDDDKDYLDTAKQVQTYVQLMQGTYGTEFKDNFPKLDKVVSWLNTMTMLASLSKAAISSQAEVAMATLGTPADLISKQLGTYAKELGTEISSDLNRFATYSASAIKISHLREVADVKLQRKLDEMIKQLNSPDLSDEEFMNLGDEVNALHDRILNRKLFHRLGFTDVGYDAAAKFEYSSATVLRKTMEVYASAIGLRAQTDANRMAVLSVAADIMSNHLEVLSSVPADKRIHMFASGRGLSVEQAYALGELQKYGLDVYKTLSLLDSLPEKSSLFNENNLTAEFAEGTLGKQVQDQMYAALANFVDARIVNPQAHNTPVYFNDPRLRVITLMGRFMATAHAVVLPRLYRDFISKGGVTMRYQAFSTIAGTLLVSAFINMLKDQLSYGDDSPYVKSKAKKAQRILNTSGLMGRYESLVNMVSPVIPSSGPEFTSNPAGWAWDKVKDNVPSASWASKVASGVGNVASGNTEKGVKQLARSAPLIGSFPIAANTLASAFKQER